MPSASRRGIEGIDVQLLSNLELRFATEMLFWRKAYEDSNPDVGIGPGTSSLLSGMLDDMGIEVCKADFDTIIKMYDASCRS